MDLILENKKLFGILFGIALIIIILIIWIPDRKLEISKYEELSTEKIDNMSSKQYGDEFLYKFYAQDMLWIKENVSSEFLEYNGIAINEYEEWLTQNFLNTSSVRLYNTTKYTYGDTSIYSIEARFNGAGKVVNIIETYPEKWVYAFDGFVSFKNEPIIKERDDYGIIINSIYQDLNYIQFNCSIVVDDNEYCGVNLSKSDSVKLTMEDNSSFIMATNNFSSEYTTINGKKYYKLIAVFNVPINNQGDVESITFNTFNVNNEDKQIKVDIEL